MNLSPFPFCDTLEDTAKSFLESHAKFVQLPKEQILFSQGDICPTVLLLTKGRVKLFLQTEEAEEITLYTLEAGEQCIINTASLLSSTPATGTAISMEAIEGYLVSVNDVKALMQQSSSYLEYVFSLYTIRMQDLATLIEDIKFKRLDQRILRWLQKEPNNPIMITHEDLASHLGSPRTVISRTLKELEKQHKLKLHRGSIERL